MLDQIPVTYYSDVLGIGLCEDFTELYKPREDCREWLVRDAFAMWIVPVPPELLVKPHKFGARAIVSLLDFGCRQTDVTAGVEAFGD
jgi:hypothetical protein